MNCTPFLLPRAFIIATTSVRHEPAVAESGDAQPAPLQRHRPLGPADPGRDLGVGELPKQGQVLGGSGPFLVGCCEVARPVQLAGRLWPPLDLFRRRSLSP